LRFNPEPPLTERRSVTSRARASVRHVLTVSQNTGQEEANLRTYPV